MPGRGRSGVVGAGAGVRVGVGRMDGISCEVATLSHTESAFKLSVLVRAICFSGLTQFGGSCRWS